MLCLNLWPEVSQVAMTPDLAVTVRQRQTERPSLQDVTPSDEQECDVFESCTGFSKYFSEQLQPIQLDAGID